MSGGSGGDPELEESADGAIDLIAFFRALSLEARRDYEALAKKDLEFGEDVAREARESGERAGRGA